jgi:hypothetical protein
MKVTEMAHTDMDALLDEGLRTAIYFLEKNGEFFPFGVTMSPDGKVNHAQGYTGDEQPPSQQVIDHLLAGMKQGAAKGDYRATALVCDTRVSTPGGPVQDAVSVTIEHHSEEPVTCYLPYTSNKGKFDFGELFAGWAERCVFASKQST